MARIIEVRLFIEDAELRDRVCAEIKDDLEKWNREKDCCDLCREITIRARKKLEEELALWSNTDEEQAPLLKVNADKLRFRCRRAPKKEH